MKEPVAIGEDTFTGLDYDKCELLVPEGSAEAYRQAAVWSNFNNITDITVVVTDYAGLLQYMIEKNDNNYKNNITRLKVYRSNQHIRHRIHPRDGRMLA